MWDEKIVFKVFSLRNWMIYLKEMVVVDEVINK